MTFRAMRYHDISCGHTVHGHEGKCANLHGHNYRVHFICESESGLDNIGRVIDFSVIKSELCMWLENEWDHKFLVWSQDPRMIYLKAIDGETVIVDFNPTAENMAKYLVEEIGPKLLSHIGIVLVECIVEETRKCSASFKKS